MRRLSILSSAAVLLLAALAGRAEIPRSPVALVHESRVEIGRGNYESARALAQEAVRLDPAFADGWKQLGRACMLARRPVDALHALDTARLLTPADEELARWQGPLYRDLGWWHWADGNPEAAVRAFNQALQEELSNRAAVIRQFAIVLAESGLADEARSFLQGRAEPDALRELARLMLDQGRPAAAEPALALLWTTGDQPVHAGVELALTRAMLGQCGELDALLTPLAGAIGRADDADVDRATEALLICNIGASTSLVARLQALNRPRDPRLSDRLRTTARAALARRDFDRSFRIYTRLIAREPDCGCFLRAAAAAEGLRGPGGAVQLLTVMLAATQNEAARAGIQGRLARLAGNTAEAAEHYARSLAADPGQDDVRREYFFALVDLGRILEARAIADAVAEREARGETALQPLLAEMWLALKDHESALSFWTTLAERHPGSAYYTVELARTLIGMNRREEAIARLETLTARTADVQALELLAHSLIDAGRNAEALRAIDQALTLEYAPSLLRLRARAGGTPEAATESR